MLHKNFQFGSYRPLHFTEVLMINGVTNDTIRWYSLTRAKKLTGNQLSLRDVNNVKPETHKNDYK